MGLQGIKDRQTDWRTGSGHNAVWWENQIDPSIVFGIPQVGCMDMRGQYAENHQLSPDIEVYNTPEKALAGEDQQLEAAVQEMLKTIGEKK